MKYTEASCINKTFTHKIDGAERPFVFRWANQNDKLKIGDWLVEECEQGVPANFYENWTELHRQNKDLSVLVLIDETDDMPVAYQFGRLLETGILQVRNNWRRKGIGRLFVEYCCQLALQDNEMVLLVECQPSSSIPFWETMGFNIFSRSNCRNKKGVRVLSKKLDLPDGGQSKLASVSWFDSDRLFKTNLTPKVNFRTDATFLAGKIYFSERVSFPSVYPGLREDAVVEIVLNEKLIFLDKAKHPDAESFGVKKCRNGFYVDTINCPSLYECIINS